MVENNKVRNSYKKLELSGQSKERIYQNILEKASDKGKKNISRWRVVLAAGLGLVLLLPGGAFAAGKLSEYFRVNIEKERYKAEISIQNTESAKSAEPGSAAESKVQTKALPVKEKKYIHISADFGPEYTTESTDDYSVEYFLQDEDKNEIKQIKEKEKEGTDGMYTFAHKDGFSAGKDFFYDVLYVDTEESAVLKLYDLEAMDELTVNGHKAFFLTSNGVQGSRYRNDEKTYYGIHLYVFYDAYGYIIDFGGMQGLGRDGIIRLAEKMTVTEGTKENASRYEYLSSYKNALTEGYTHQDTEKDVTERVHSVKDTVTYENISYQVTDVQVSEKLPKLTKKNFYWGAIELDPEEYTDEAGRIKKACALWDKNGNLKSYLREKTKWGDGVLEPERSVIGEERVKLKAVTVTMKVKVEDKEVWCFELPRMELFEKENGKYYETNRYHDDEYYNRPKLMHDIHIDNMPCYFKETSGGKGFYLKMVDEGEIPVGKEVTYHFMYILDEDMLEHMCLVFGSEYTGSENPYVDLGL